MMSNPFRISTPKRVATRVSLEPVYNALTSLSLLHVGDYGADVDPWVTRTAAQLSPEQRQRNRLVFEGLGEVLITEQEWSNFPAYLDYLSGEQPIALRDRLLARICRPAFGFGDQHSSRAPEPTQLLTDQAAFVRQIERVSPADSVDQELQSEVHRLLNEPLALHDLLVSHLRTMWELFLADEWGRRAPFLQRMVGLLGNRTWPSNADEAVRMFIGRELPISISTQLQGVQQIVFSLSPHIGPFASRFGSESTIWVFVRGRVYDRKPHSRPDLDLPVRQSPIKPIELVAPFSALADETRLHILGLLAKHGELLAQDIIAQLDLSQSSISRHLKQLTTSGFLLERRGEGANKSYRLDPVKLDRTFFELKQLLSGDQSDPVADARESQPVELRRFLNNDGQVASWPAKQRDKLLVLEYLASQFEPGREYAEKEVNQLLDQHIAKRHKSGAPTRGLEGAVDFATLRRYLYDEHLLDRTQDGSRYWRPTAGD